MLTPIRLSFGREPRQLASQPPASRCSRRRSALRSRPLIEGLEGRQLLSTFTVSNTLDDGSVGSLRWAITQVDNGTSTTNTIDFKIAPGGVQTIAPATALPTITRPVTIDGTTQAGYAGNPVIVLSGADNSYQYNGLTVDAAKVTVKGLVIDGFSSGVFIESTQGVVENCYIGTDPTGKAAVGNAIGVSLAPGSSGATVGGTTAATRDVISGNALYGVSLDGTTKDRVEGDFIGTDYTGTVALGNGNSGVLIQGGATANTVGGTVAGARNIISGNGGVGISGNGGAGVIITAFGTNGNLVEGDDIGTDVSGMLSVSNSADGVIISSGASANTVGGTVAGARDVISGNTAAGPNSNGVLIIGTGAAGNKVEGDFIGTNASGSNSNGNGALPNGGNGVQIQDGATNNIIGGTVAGALNVISGNAYSGVVIEGLGTTGNKVEGDNIGVDVSTYYALPNGIDGVAIQGSASKNTVGGTTAATRDVISGNGTFGVELYQAGTTGNVVEGDDIGSLPSYLIARPNGSNGVFILGGASNNTIGGTVAGARDVISGNGQSGVGISDPGTSGNVVEGDFIGTDPTGGGALPNGNDGVVIQNGATKNTIGGTTAAARNVISGNTAAGPLSNGVVIGDPGTSNDVVEGNYIGLNAAGNAALANGGNGVQVQNGATNNTVGGTANGSGNVISGNTYSGVVIVGTNGNVVEGNFIGTNPNGSAPVSNRIAGVALLGGASNNTIGGMTPAARNVISGNLNGVLIRDAGTSGNVVEGDDIGVNAAGTGVLTNGNDGVILQNGATNNVIGGTVAAARDIISGNGTDGVFLSDPGTSNNVVEGDYIGTDPTGTLALPNIYAGVSIANGASSNTIGSTTNAIPDVISGNNNTNTLGGFGVVITGPGTNNNLIIGDDIGTTASGLAALANQTGVLITDGASANMVNYSVISGNLSDGVEITGANTTNNSAGYDLIGTGADGTTVLGNGYSGVLLLGCSGNFVSQNTIANNYYGILLVGTTGPNTVTPNTFSNNRGGDIVTQ